MDSLPIDRDVRPALIIWFGGQSASILFESGEMSGIEAKLLKL